MASESAAKKRKDAAELIEQPAKKLKPTDDTTSTTAHSALAANHITTAPTSDAATTQSVLSLSLFTPQLLSKLLAIMLHCAAQPLYQPAPTVSAHSRSSDVLSSVLRAMDERIAEVALEVEQIIPNQQQRHIRHLCSRYSHTQLHRLTHHSHCRTRTAITVTRYRHLTTVATVRTVIRPAP